MLTTAVLPISLGIAGLIAAFLVYARILQTPAGEGRVKEIADEIHLGAMVFMASEYKRLGIFCIICIVALYASLGSDTALAFTLGALCSGTAGYIGMYTATKANVRTAVADVASWTTPVPGGVGPVTVAMLMRNAAIAFEKKIELGWV